MRGLPKEGEIRGSVLSGYGMLKQPIHCSSVLAADDAFEDPDHTTLHPRRDRVLDRMFHNVRYVKIDRGFG